jgi:lipoprotein-releasing system permease protein
MFKKIPMWLWMAIMISKQKGKRLNISTVFALIGLILGVASMVVAMAVMSGFEVSLKHAMIDVVGHILIVKRSKDLESSDVMLDKLKKINPAIIDGVPFTSVEAVGAHKGVIKGVYIQGVDVDQADKNLGLKRRLVEGEVYIKDTVKDTVKDNKESQMRAIVGRSLAKEFNLKVGETFKIVLPVVNELNPTQFSRKVGQFLVTGIVDLGKFNFDERYIITDLKSVQRFAGLGNKYHGMIVMLSDEKLARPVSFQLSSDLGPSYWIREWQDDNLFEAVKIEKIVIFFVLLLMVIVAAFNISSSLFINVVQKYSDISLLKALGASQKFILKVFCSQGLIIGFVGVTIGFIMGLIFCWIFLFMQDHFALLNSAVYKLNRIDVQIRFTDVFAICISAMVICFISSLAPAWRGARLNPVEGLRYE